MACGSLQMLINGAKGPLPLLSLQALPAALASTPSAIWEPMLPEVCACPRLGATHACKIDCI